MQWPINRAQISKFQDFELCNLCIQNVVTAINASRNIYACINKCRYRVQPACLHRRVVMVISCIIYTSELMITCLTRRKMRWQWHVYERLRIIIVHRVLQYCSNLISDSMQYQHHHLHTSSQHPSHSCSNKRPIDFVRNTYFSLTSCSTSWFVVVSSRQLDAKFKMLNVCVQ